MNQINITPEMQTLIAKWKEAKAAETGWANIRKAAEDEMTALNGDYDELLGAIAEKPVLSTSAELGPDLKVTAGYQLKADQALAAQFVRLHPELEGVIFKVEYKPQAKALLNAILGNSPLKAELEEMVSYPKTRPSYARR